MADGTFRLRVRYGKRDRLRHLSHLEVMRACERSVRRAELPYSITQGFSPRMKSAFGPALPVGTAGEHEYYDLWLREYVPAGEAMRRLARATPAALGPSATRYVAERGPSLSAALVVARYRVGVSSAMGPEELGGAMERVVNDGMLAVEHKGRRKVFDLARMLPEEPRVTSADEGLVVHVTTRIGQEGSLRPEALVGEALTRSDTPGRISAVTRTDLFAEADGGLAEPME